MVFHLPNIHAFLDLVNHVFLKPFHTLSVLPEAFLWWLSAFVAMVSSITMLLSLVPPALVETTIGPLVAPETLLFVAHKLSVVSHFVSILIQAKTIHVVFRPLAVVALAVCPSLRAIPVDLVHPPFAIID